MARPGQMIVNPITRERIVFRHTPGSTGGAYCEFDHAMPPGAGRFNPHLHLDSEERYAILAGRASYRLNGVDAVAQPGALIVVPPGAPHINPWNRDGDDILLTRVTATPPKAVDIFFETLFGLARDGRTSPRGEMSILQVVVIAHDLHTGSYVAGLPLALQRALFPGLAALGHALGYRGRYARYSGP